jgi:hypothetical protein
MRFVSVHSKRFVGACKFFGIRTYALRVPRVIEHVTRDPSLGFARDKFPAPRGGMNSPRWAIGRCNNPAHSAASVRALDLNPQRWAGVLVRTATNSALHVSV